MTTREFTIQDQLQFAELSGDFNPIHVDELAARRLVYGQVVVHGVHLVLWGLNVALQTVESTIKLDSVRAHFLKPVFLGQVVRCDVRREGSQKVAIDLIHDGAVLAVIQAEWHSAPHESDASGLITSDRESHADKGLRGEPKELTPENVSDASGGLPLYCDAELANRMFANVERSVSRQELATLLGCTRLVGMECPGLHSLFSQLNLISQEDEPLAQLNFEVTKHNARFGLVVMKVVGAGLAGTITAFVRPASAEQLTYHQAQQLVAPDEFAGQHALVVGGSRGLGEVVVKLLCAGGAQVVTTYHRGRTDAERLVDEIREAGGAVETMQFDVQDEVETSFVQGFENTTHLYYLATPFIFEGEKGRFCPERFHRFCRYYVDGFANLLTALKDHALRRAFYPSSVAVEELPADMGEYAAAKQAGESLCEFFNQHTRVETTVLRLPRLATDQTQSMVPVENLDPIPVLLKMLRA